MTNQLENCLAIAARMVEELKVTISDRREPVEQFKNSFNPKYFDVCSPSVPVTDDAVGGAVAPLNCTFALYLPNFVVCPEAFPFKV